MLKKMYFLGNFRVLFLGQFDLSKSLAHLCAFYLFILIIFDIFKNVFSVLGFGFGFCSFQGCVFALKNPQRLNQNKQISLVLFEKVSSAWCWRIFRQRQQQQQRQRRRRTRFVSGLGTGRGPRLRETPECSQLAPLSGRPLSVRLIAALSGRPSFHAFYPCGCAFPRSSALVVYMAPAWLFSSWYSVGTRKRHDLGQDIRENLCLKSWRN